MKPDFALSLSQEGIALFHRVPDGWDELGSVAVDSTDLVAELAALRGRGLEAAGLDGKATLPCKIVIPNDLVRYIALDNPRASEAEVLAALDGSTPYRLTELAHDHRAGGGRMHIAAVARENLDEAEGFAAEHGFAPVAFVATPEPFTFPGEVNFGTTRLAATILPAGEVFEPDAEGVPITPASFAIEIHEPGPVVTEPVIDPVIPPLPPEYAADPVAEEEVAETPVEAQEDDAPEPADDEAEEAVEAEAQPADEPAPVVAESEAVTEDTALTVDEPEDESDMPEEEDAAEDSTPPPVFASRSRPQGIAPAPPPPPLDPGPPLTAKADAEGEPSEPVFASRTSRQPLVGAEGRAEPPLSAGKATPPPASPTLPPPAITMPDADPKSAAIIPLAAPVKPAGAPLTTPAMPGQHAARAATATPAPKSRQPRPQPRRRIGLGLVLTLVLLVLLAGVALWSTTLEGGLSAWLDSDRRDTVVIPAPDSGPADPIAAAGEAAPITTGGLDAAAEPGPEAGDIAPELAQGPGPDSAATAPTSADEDTRGATRPDLTAPEGEDGSLAALSADATEPDTSMMARGESRESEASTTARDLLAAAAGAAAVVTLVTPEEADRVYEATGVWLRAPRLPVLPRGDALDDMVLSSADAARDSSNPTGLPDDPGLAPDPGLPQQPDPPPAGTVLSRDARGLIAATPEGVLLPTGITVFAGPPPRNPPTRPGTEVPPAAEAAAAVEFSGIRPPVRPASILEAAIAAGAVEAEPEAEAEEPEAIAEDEAEPAEDEDSAELDASAGGVGLALVAPDLRPATRPDSIIPPPSWDGKQPPNRPASFASLASPATEEPATPADPVAEALSTITAGPDALEGVTARAVPQALRPDSRPRNFNRVVETQTEILARASTATPAEPPPTAPAAEAQPAAAPAASGGNVTSEEAAEAATDVSTIAAPATGPTPGGAAQAATVSRAINLREINLIGVFGPQSARRALVRLANGRLVRVGVGDSLDGGQVVAIGDGVLNYSKRGQTYSLRVPG